MVKKTRDHFARWRLLAQSGSRRFSIETRDGKTWAKGNTPAVLKMIGCELPRNDMPRRPPAPFDEIVVGNLIHAERMSDNEIWVRLGNACFWLKARRDGKIDVTLTEGAVDKKTGRISGGRE